MPTRLDSLRVEAALDASQYVAGAQKKSAADKQMIDSAKALDAATEQTQRRVTESATAIDRVSRALVPLEAAQQKMATAQNTIQRAFDQGRISQDRYYQLLSAAEERYARAAQGSIGFANAVNSGGASMANTFSLNRNGLLQLQASGVNAFQALASGMSVTRVATMEGAQVLGAFVQGGAIGFSTLAGAAGIAAAGLAGVVLPMALIASRAIDLQNEAREVGIALRAMGSDAALTTTQVHGLVEQLRDQGLSKADARTAVIGSLRSPGATGQGVTAAASLAPDVAAVYGGHPAEIMKSLTEAYNGGFDAIQKLNAAYHLFDAEQLNSIRLMIEHGDRARAVQVAFSALSDKVKGSYKDSLTEGQKAIQDLSRAWDDMVDNLARGAIGQISIKIIRDTANSVGPVQPYVDTVRPWADLYSRFIGQPFSNLVYGLAGRTNPTQQAAMEAAGAAGGGGPRAPISGAGLPGPPTARPGGSGAGFTSEGSAAVVAATAAYQDQNRILSAGIGIRDEVRARVEAEREAITKNWTAAEKGEFVEQKVIAAKRQMASAVNDNLVVMRSETDGIMATAAAYGQSLAAGKSAEADAQARSEKLRNAAVDEKALATAIRDRAAAQGLVSATQARTDSEFQAGLAEKSVIAARGGAEASQEAARQAEVETFKRNALATATDKTREAVEKEIVAYDQASQRRLTATQQIERETAVRQAGYDIQISGMQAAAGSLTDPEQINRANMAIDRQQKINQLTEQYGTVAEGTGKQLLGMWDQSAANRDQSRYWSEVRSQAQSVASDVSGFLVDGLVNVNKGGKSTFQNLWDTVQAGAMRMMTRIAANILEQKIIMPITMSLVDSASGLFGIAAPAAAGAAGAGTAGGGLLGSLFGRGAKTAASAAMPAVQDFGNEPLTDEGVTEALDRAFADSNQNSDENFDGLADEIGDQTRSQSGFFQGLGGTIMSGLGGLGGIFTSLLTQLLGAIGISSASSAAGGGAGLLGLFGLGGSSSGSPEFLGGGEGLGGSVLEDAAITGFAGGGIMTRNGPIPLRMYTAGGIANSPQMSIYGEGRTPEAYVPLPDGRRIPVRMESNDNRAGGSVVVQNIDMRSSGAPVETRQSRDNDGRTVIRNFIRDETQKNIADGRFDKNFEAGFGVKRLATNRG